MTTSAFDAVVVAMGSEALRLESCREDVGRGWPAMIVGVDVRERDAGRESRWWKVSGAPWLCRSMLLGDGNADEDGKGGEVLVDGVVTTVAFFFGKSGISCGWRRRESVEIVLARDVFFAVDLAQLP